MSVRSILLRTVEDLILAKSELRIIEVDDDSGLIYLNGLSADDEVFAAELAEDCEGIRTLGEGLFESEDFASSSSFAEHCRRNDPRSTLAYWECKDFEAQPTVRFRWGHKITTFRHGDWPKECDQVRMLLSNEVLYARITARLDQLIDLTYVSNQNFDWRECVLAVSKSEVG